MTNFNDNLARSLGAAVGGVLGSICAFLGGLFSD